MRRRRLFIVRTQTAAQGRADQSAQDRLDIRNAVAGGLCCLQFRKPCAVGGDAPGDKEFGDQLVLGAEMIVHRREIDARRRHDVAQRDIAEAALGIKPLGGVQDQGAGPV